MTLKLALVAFNEGVTSPHAWLADVHPADNYQGQLLAGLWLMGVIGLLCAAMAIFLWRAGRRGSGAPSQTPAEQAQRARDLGFLALAAVFGLAAWEVGGWAVGVSDDTELVTHALDKAHSVIAVLLAAAATVTAVLYTHAKIQASRARHRQDR